MINDKYLVIIPTYNESETIARIVPDVLASDKRIDVLVVDDNSPDGTGEIAEHLAGEISRVHFLRRQQKDGIGKAYVSGFLWGIERGYRLLFEMDADYSHDPGHLPAFIDKAASFDVVIGSRYLGGKVTAINWSMGRLVLSYFGNWYARKITRLPLSDATGGFNCWRREVLSALDLSLIQSNGYTFQIELKMRAWRKGFTLTEIPILFRERASGESKMSNQIVCEAIWKVWMLRVIDLFGHL